MQRLFLFLYHYRAFLTFLFLQVLCSWLIIQNNEYQGAKFFNSSNRMAAGLLQTSGNVSDYFGLANVNKDLALENAALKERLVRLNESIYSLNTRQMKDNEIINRYEYQTAKVINNSIRQFDNHITINKGDVDGIEPGMGVIDNNGVVGKVKAVSRHFSVITSILHSNVLISAKIKRTGDLSTVKWGGIDPYASNLLYVPRHVGPEVGDTVVTSGYNTVFPEGIPIGVISKVEIREDALFYDIRISLASDLNKLSYVYLIKNNLKIEQDSLEINSQTF